MALIQTREEFIAAQVKAMEGRTPKTREYLMGIAFDAGAVFAMQARAAKKTRKRAASPLLLPAEPAERVALAELVALKDLNERIKTLANAGYEGTLTGGEPSWPEHDSLLDEYMRRKPIAWAAARAALAGVNAEPAAPLALIERLKAAIEGECDGLAIDNAHAKAILEYVLGHPVAAPIEPPGAASDWPADSWVSCALDLAEQMMRLSWATGDDSTWRPKYQELSAFLERIAARAAIGSEQDARDAARLDWLIHHLSGKELRRIGIETQSGGPLWTRVAIDAAMAAAPGEQA